MTLGPLRMRFRSRTVSSAVGAGVLLAAVALPVLATSQAGPLTVSVTMSPNPYAIEGTTSVTKSVGLLGYGTGATDVALEGYVTQPGSTGLEGFSQATSGTIGDGVFGYSGNGAGVFGVAASGVGVYGTSTASNGTGIEGVGNSVGVDGSGEFGVFGETIFPSGAGVPIAFPGVYGLDDSSGTMGELGVEGASTYGIGVLGTTAGKGTTGYGVYGADTSSSNPADVVALAGVYGSSINNSGLYGTSTNGYGLYAASSQNYGVYATTNSVNSMGLGFSSAVYGEGLGLDNNGIEGVSDSTGVGVLGEADDNGIGLEASVNGASPAGVYVRNEATDSGVGIDIGIDNGYAIVAGAYGGDPYTMSLDAAGNMILAGSLTQRGTPYSTVRDANGSERVAYAARQTQSTLEDAGEAQMHGGRAYVALDPEFAGTLDPDRPYLVFITALGPNTGTYVANRSLRGFEVRDSSGRGDLAFDYRIVGRPRGAGAEPRLAAFVPPRIPHVPSSVRPRIASRRAAHAIAPSVLADSRWARTARAAAERPPFAAARRLPLPFIAQPAALAHSH